jgi:hypothetical protein
MQKKIAVYGEYADGIKYSLSLRIFDPNKKNSDPKASL